MPPADPPALPVLPAPALSSTLGGTGWLPRVGSLADDLSAGTLWRRAGSCSEVAALRTVLLVEPPDSLGAVKNPGAMLMLAPVNLAQIRAEYDGLCAAFAAEGVEVLRYRADPPGSADPADPGSPQSTVPPNLIFARDLLWMTPEGAVIGRMAAAQRAGEERHALRALALAGIPVRATIGGRACFEGADALWLSPEDVLIGLKRTDDAALNQLRALFPALHFHTCPVPPAAQHLLGVLAPLAPGLALLHPDGDPALCSFLAARRVRTVAPDPGEQARRRAMNIVALGGGRVLMPSGCRMGICFGCVAPLRQGAVRDLRSGEITTAAPGDGVVIQTCISAAAGACEIEL